MARPIVMPSMSMYADEGRLVAWLRPAGCAVTAGEPVAEVTTEKAAFEIEAPAAGILHPLADVGATLAVEAVMGYVLAEGEAPPAAPGAGPARAEAPGAAVETARPAAAPPAAPPPRPSPPPPASPIARRLAAQHGIDLAAIVGTGPGGRIVEADVLAARARTASPVPQGPTVLRRTPLAGIRRIIGERLRTSLMTAVSTTLSRHVQADALVAARPWLAERLGGTLPLDALFLKLFATALREHPELNASIQDGEILTYDDVHVGFAVSAPTGLLVPVVRHADRESLAAIARQVRELSDRARAGRLGPEDMAGGTATISNLGAHGIDAFTPILNPPQSAILGIGRIAPAPVVHDGRLAAGHACTLSLTFDHRVADGVPAAQLLDSVARRCTDEPWLLALARVE